LWNFCRLALNNTGLAEALVMLRLHYGSEQSLKVTAETMRLICHTAYHVSIDLAEEKGSFPDFDKEKYLKGAFICALPGDIRLGIEQKGKGFRATLYAQADIEDASTTWAKHAPWTETSRLARHHSNSRFLQKQN
jgi:ribonucleotide reductase alpha subunit